MNYGPHTAKVEALINRCRTLTFEETSRLIAESNKCESDMGDELGFATLVAWDVTYDTIDSDPTRRNLSDAWGTATGLVPPDAKIAVGSAVLGIVTQDLITPEQYATLIRPWETAMGASCDN